VVDFWVAGAAIYTLNTYCMFELDDGSYVRTNYDDLNLKLDFMSRARRRYKLFKDMFPTQRIYNASCNVDCFL